MAEFEVKLDKGRKTSGDKQRFVNGYLSRLENAIYMPDDPDRPHKIPGRSNLGALPGGATASNTKGMAFARFDTGKNSNVLVLNANDQFYQASVAGGALGAWSDVDNGAGTPFVRAGNFIKAIPSGLRGMIFWTDEDNNRPLLRDEDGNWRELGMLAPAPPTFGAALAAAGTAILPTSNSQPATVSEGTVDDPYTSRGLAQDGDFGTAAGAIRTTPGISAGQWNFTTATLGVAHTLTVYVTAGFGAFLSVDKPLIQSALSSEVLLRVEVALDWDGATGTFVTAASGFPFGGPAPITFPIPNGQQMDDVAVRVTLNYKSGTLQAFSGVFDIQVRPDNRGKAAKIDNPDGDSIQYAVTEVYSITLASGFTIIAESGPSDPSAAIFTPDDVTDAGITLTMPPVANPTSTGVSKQESSKILLNRNIYRSTLGGGFPNLGRIGILDATTTTFIDDFIPLDEDTLGSPGLATVAIGEATFPLSSPPPAFLDAVLFRGSVVAVPVENPSRIVWTPPGFPDYFPIIHDFSLTTQDRSDDLKGVTAVGDNLIIFMRQQVLRIRDLPMANASGNFDLTTLQIDRLSPSEGMPGRPKSYTQFHSQKGHAVVAWIGDNGIWMTDGSLVSERGMGLVKLSSHKDWIGDVDPDSFADDRLTYDPVLQMLVFDYIDRDGTLRTEYLHVAPHHWQQSGQDQMVPKFSGPHTLTASDRLVVENVDDIVHFSLDLTNLRILQERNGTQDVADDIQSHIETEWILPVGSRTVVQLYAGELFHSDWGVSELCDLEIQMRMDESGIIQSTHKKGVSLTGDRLSQLVYLEGSAQSVRVIIRQKGKTTFNGSPQRAFGPLVLEMERVDEIRKE